MLRINQLKLPVGHTQAQLAGKVKKLLRCSEEPEIFIVRRSVDARKKPELYFNYILNIKVKNQKEVYKKCDKKQVSCLEEETYRFPVKEYAGDVRPVIIGMGPAGLFCGYMLAKAGFRPILLERGKAVEERICDVEHFWATGSLNPESNVQFGEGGAGTFSDGKLNTLVKDKYGRNKKVLSIFVEAGAPEEILYDHKPHIGTDVLSKVVKNMREEIIRLGGEVRFQTKVTGVLSREGRLSGLLLDDGEVLETGYAVLAIGHSARDTFYMLHEAEIPMEAKPFAIGMRVEHPQRLINLSQYGMEEHEILGNAPYKVTAQSEEGRGVYSFCMCPGGYVVNASSEEGRLAVNGMSYSGRDGKNANSAIIVSVTPEDFVKEAGEAYREHPLAGVAFQRKLEEKAYALGNGKILVETFGEYKKAVRKECREALKDSMQEVSRDNIDDVATGKGACEALWDDFSPSVKGGWEYGPVHEILPESLSKAFVEGMEQFGRTIKGFADCRVLVEGLESRTSSPVRILRDDSLQIPTLKGMYPCGEGAGYAGGITSAAMDGIKVAEAIAEAIAKAD
ncbi:MAG: FAD-dependent oxidoreductase [Lachnospiraceae bacterium]|nr:FAD-dependent oxidoreductase [Lachnospiraceae bacterium]